MILDTELARMDSTVAYLVFLCLTADPVTIDTLIRLGPFIRDTHRLSSTPPYDLLFVAFRFVPLSRHAPVVALSSLLFLEICFDSLSLSRIRRLQRLTGRSIGDKSL